MTDRLFSYPDRATAEAVRDALRRIAPAFSLEKGPVADSLDTEGLSRVRHAQPLAEGEDVFWIVGDRRLIALFELAGCVFEKGGLPAARSSLEAIHDRTTDRLGEAGQTVQPRQTSEADTQEDASKGQIKTSQQTAIQRRGSYQIHRPSWPTPLEYVKSVKRQSVYPSTGTGS